MHFSAQGIQRARDVGFIDWNSGSSTWSLEEYEYYEQVRAGAKKWAGSGGLGQQQPRKRCALRRFAARQKQGQIGRPVGTQLWE